MHRRFAAAAVIALSLAAGHALAQAKPDTNPGANIAFLGDNAKQPGVVTLPDGLQYRITTAGPAGSDPAHAEDEVKVNYEGAFLSGDVFDSSFKRGEPASFPVEEVIPGWTEVLQLMRPGDDWIVWVPPWLGYGPEKRGPIPGNSILKFRIQLLGVLRPAAVPRG